ncbi:hypothetical protein [Rhodopseudomonas sp. B29]|uniref:hypothetical protein n=1 Tax=Rhodopseudomonas sp. B29 TaxID=95607 RepID=UPI0003467782|nr:hypothetical protein [Rhodopseudomonas sp. B29]
MIITSAGIATVYSRSVAASDSSRAQAATDAQASSEDTTAAQTSGYRLDPSQVRSLPAGTPISALTDPELRDMLATAWLTMQRGAELPADAADNAPQNTYAQVKVGNKVVATLYNGGISEMSNATAAAVSELVDPPGLSGPNLAQWRADNYARLLGGTVEKAPTAITQSQWTPRPSTSSSYSRDQLDAAFAAMVAEGQRTAAQNMASYQQPASPQSRQADLTA